MRNSRVAASVAAVAVLALSTLAPPVGAAQPSSAPPSTVGLPPFTDVQEYRNTNYRTGVFAGPGPAAQPVKVWSRTVDGSIDFTPQLADGMLLVGATEGNFYALDARTGKERWRFATGGSTVRFGSVADGTVVFSTDGTLHALDLAAGTERWNRPGVGTVSVIDDGVVYFPGSDGHVYGAKLATGEQVWDWASPGTVTDISVADGTAYASVDNGRLYAISIADGTETWHLQSSGSTLGIPTIGTDQLFVTADSGGDGHGAEFYAVDRATGKVQWTFQTPNLAGLRPGAMEDGVYYLGSIGDGLYALPTAADASGTAPKPIWHTHVDGASWRNQAVAGDTVYVPLWDKDEVVALDKATGAIRWTIPLPGHPSGALVSGGMLFVADQTGAVSAYAEPDLAAAIGPVSTGRLIDPASADQPPDPFTVVRTLDPSTTTLKSMLAFDVGPNGLIYALDAKPSVTVIDPATGKVVRTWGRRGVGEGEFDFGSNPVYGWIDVAPDGTVVVADSANHRLQAFTPDGTFIRQMGSFGQGAGQFSRPYVITTDSDGSVYAVDADLGSLTKFDKNGAFAWRAAGSPGGNTPVALPDGSIAWLVGNNRVQRIDAANGAPLDSWGSAGRDAGELDAPCVISVDSLGNQYIFGCDPVRTQVFDANHKLIAGAYASRDQVVVPVFGPNGAVYGHSPEFSSDDIYVLNDSLLAPPDPFTVVRTLEPSTTGLGTIESFDVGPDGLIYVLDLKPSVSVIDPATGKVVRSWGRQGTGEGEFDLRDLSGAGNPGTGDIAVGKDGTVYVADGSNHRVQVFAPDGTFIRQMGSFGTQDGQFQATRLIAVDADGSVYVGDDPTGALTKFGPDGAFVWRNPGGSQSTGPTVQLPDGRIVSLGEAGVATLDAATGKVVDRWGTPGFKDGELSNMCYVTADAAGNEYIFSCQPDRTQVFDPQHRLIGGDYSSDGQRVFVPKFGPHGEVYATDWFASNNLYVLKDSLMTP